MFDFDVLFNGLTIIVAASIFFVWVVRYENIISEFKEYGIPSWVRDFVGILKIAFAAILVSQDGPLIVLASAAVTLMMAAAVMSHVRVKHPIYKMLPSLSLMTICAFICYAELLQF